LEFCNVVWVQKTIPCLKKYLGHFYFYDNLGKSGPSFIFFTELDSDSICGKIGIKTITSPQICCCTTLWKQVVNYTASVHSDENV